MYDAVGGLIPAKSLQARARLMRNIRGGLVVNIIYRRPVPYPPPVVLSAYFALEHVGHVHPSSFGRARLLGTRQDTVIWELESPPYLGVRFRNVIAQEYLSLYQIRARVTKGLLRGTEVSVRLEPNDAGTSIEETYVLPLPDLPLVGPLLRTWFVRKADEIWAEDLDVAERTVSRLMPKRRPRPSQTWRTFLDNHVRDLVSLDFFTVPTARLRVLFVLVVLVHHRRRVVHFNVTEHPTAHWTAQQIVDAFPDDSAPAYLLRDRDSVYGHVFRQRVKGMGIGEVLTAPYCPWQNPLAERLIGSIRHECL